jgi:hypothetical protein
MFGRLNVSGVTGSTFGIDAPLAGWDSTEIFRIGALTLTAEYYWHGAMNHLIVGNGTAFTEAERDWMIDKTWAEIVTGMGGGAGGARRLTGGLTDNALLGALA